MADETVTTQEPQDATPAAEAPQIPAQPPESTSDVQEAPETTVDEPDAGADTFSRGYVRQLRDEAAKHRQAARDAAAERDDLRTRVDAMELVEFQRRAVQAGLLPDAIDDVMAMIDLDEDVRDEHGMLDPEKIDAGVQQLRAARPHWFKRAPIVPGGVMGPPPSSGPSFASHLKGVVGGR